MLVKIKPDYYINTDHVLAVFKDEKLTHAFANDNEEWIIELPDRTEYITAAAASFLMDHMNAASSLIFSGEAPQVEKPMIVGNQTLRSRIAQILKYSPGGQTINELIISLTATTRLNYTESEISTALDELNAENLIRATVNGDEAPNEHGNSPVRYWHVTNFSNFLNSGKSTSHEDLFTASPDPLNESGW